MAFAAVAFTAASADQHPSFSWPHWRRPTRILVSPHVTHLRFHVT
jgi:hypothetical protein